MEQHHWFLGGLLAKADDHDKDDMVIMARKKSDLE